jgi:hypothetical protein
MDTFVGSAHFLPLLPLILLATMVTAAAVAETTPDAKPPAQVFRDQRHVWNFDDDQPGQPPAAFRAETVGAGSPGSWKVEADARTPSPPNRVVQATPCLGDGCYQVLLAESVRYEYPEAAVRLRALTEVGQAAAGIIFDAKDPRTFYAALADVRADVLEVVRVVDGQITVLGREPLKRRPGDWHTLRVQHNTILSKDYLEISFDGRIVFSRWDPPFGGGQVGLVTRGDSPIAFDNLHVVQLYAQRPMSPPAAY